LNKERRNNSRSKRNQVERERKQIDVKERENSRGARDKINQR
jgi:hypothetical protein